jgi:protein SCO1
MYIKNKVLQLVAVVAISAASVSLCAQAPASLQAGQGNTNLKVPILEQVGIDQRLNQQISLDLTFVDENGKTVQLRQYFGSKPVILALIYYQCPMLCSQELNGLVDALNGVTHFNIGREFNVVTVSFDPRDTPSDAADTKKKYLPRYHRSGADENWHFLTGKQDQIAALTKAVGFRYVWDPEIKQFAHASGIMLLTPDGRVAQYYYGIEYAPRDIQLGLVEASQRKIGNVVDQVLLLCYHYDPQQGTYGAAIFNILRISALVTILVLGGLVIVMARRRRIT